MSNTDKTAEAILEATAPVFSSSSIPEPMGTIITNGYYRDLQRMARLWLARHEIREVSGHIDGWEEVRDILDRIEALEDNDE